MYMLFNFEKKLALLVEQRRLSPVEPIMHNLPMREQFITNALNCSGEFFAHVAQAGIDFASDVSDVCIDSQVLLCVRV